MDDSTFLFVSTLLILFAIGTAVFRFPDEDQE